MRSAGRANAADKDWLTTAVRPLVCLVPCCCVSALARFLLLDHATEEYVGIGFKSRHQVFVKAVQAPGHDLACLGLLFPLVGFAGVAVTHVLKTKQNGGRSRNLRPPFSRG